MSNTQETACPVCGTKYIGEHTVVSPNPDLVMNVRECTNQHSWGSPLYPRSISEAPTDPPAFENVYRPLYDTQEPVKRLFKS